MGGLFPGRAATIPTCDISSSSSSSDSAGIVRSWKNMLLSHHHRVPHADDYHHHRARRSQYQPIRDTTANTTTTCCASEEEEEDSNSKYASVVLRSHHQSAVVSWRPPQQQHPQQQHAQPQHPHRPAPGTIADFFFGFMYEEEDNDDDDFANSNKQSSYHRIHAGVDERRLGGDGHDDTGDDDDGARLLLLLADEDPPLDEEDVRSSSRHPSWNHPLFVALAAYLFLLSAASAMAINVSTAAITQHHHQQQQQYNNINKNHPQEDNNSNRSSSNSSSSAGQLSTQMTSAAVMGTALGKFMLGPIPDVLGARRTALRTTLGIAATWGILLITTSSSSSSILPVIMVWGPLVLEFLNSVQWPCTVIILAGHRVPDGTGIVVTSVAARLGSLVGMMVSQQVLWWYHPSSSSSWHWRLLAGLATWSALVAASVLYLYVQDTPDQPDAPTHPVHAHIMKLWFPHEYYSYSGRRKSSSSSSWTMGQRWRWSWWVATGHAGPAVWKLLTSGPTFWILALAHTGSLVVRTAERILPAYAAATHMTTHMTTTTMTHTTAYAYDAASTVETVDQHDLYQLLDAPPLLAAYSSAGTVLGLLFVGRLFANQADHPRARKWLVGRLYAVAVAACYVLAGLAVPVVVQSLPSQLVALGQVLAVTVASAAVAVPCFHIPSLVAAQQQQQQQHDRGLFLAYTDGVAYGLASLVWKFLSGRLARSDGTSTNSNSSSSTTATTTASDTSGWAYGWAAVALLLLVAGVTMTEFMEHYFCSAAAVRNRRQRQFRGGTYETILLA